MSGIRNKGDWNPGDHPSFECAKCRALDLATFLDHVLPIQVFLLLLECLQQRFYLCGKRNKLDPRLITILQPIDYGIQTNAFLNRIAESVSLFRRDGIGQM